MEPLEVRLFGGFTLRRREEVVAPIPSRIGRSLFAYLALNLGTAVPRERLVAEFWPERSESRGRRRLSHSLWQLQDALSELPGGASYLEVGTDTLAIAPAAPVTVDVVEFERRLDELRHLRAEDEVRARDLVRLEGVVELYRGDLLPGHDEPWVQVEQERLGQRYLEALSRLVSMAGSLGASEDALLYARRLTHQDPLREDGHREVMRLSMLLGRPGDALRQYERCRAVLAEELGTDPSRPTRELFERILRQGHDDGVDPVPASFPARPPMVGRHTERAAALAVVDAALGGRGGVVLVEGDAGSGKSRLLEELVGDAGWRGFVAATGRCRGVQEAGPFASIRELIEGTITPLRLEQLRNAVAPVWLAVAARLIPALAPAVRDDATSRGELAGGAGAQRMRDAMVRILLALSRADPLLLVVDDAQWVDADSLAVLAKVGDELRGHQAVLAFGYRGEDARARPELWQVLQDLDRELRPARLVLGPLDTSSIGELARVVTGRHRVDPAAAARLRRETGGNPLFVLTTLRELADRDQLAALAEGAAELPLPSSVRELVSTQLDRLKPEPREVLDVVAVVGDHTDLDTLEAVTELPRGAVVSAVDALLRRGLLREVGDAYGVHHDQIRRACLDDLDDASARELHRTVGEVLASRRPDEPERIAHHLVVAGDGRRAVDHLVAAGRRAASLHAYASAEGFLQRAAEEQRRGPFRADDRFELLTELGAVLYDRGEPRAALEAADRAAEIADSLGDQLALALVRLNSAVIRYQTLGHDEVARRDLSRALEFFEHAGELRFAGSCHESLAGIALRHGRLDEAAHHLDAADALTDGGADPWADIGLWRRRAELAFAQGDVSAALGHARRARELAEDHELLGHLRASLMLLARLHLQAGDPDGACDLADRALATLDAGKGYSRLAHLLHLVQHDALAGSGQVSAARRAALTGASGLRRMLDTLAPEDRERAAGIPEHARLLDLAEELAPRQVVVEVAASDAPAGRPLRASELVVIRVEVDPLVDEGTCDGTTDPVERRRIQLTDAVEQATAQGGAVTVSDLARILEVSAATVRRDLAALRRRGCAVPTRGAKAG